MWCCFLLGFWQDGSYLVLVGGGVQGLSFVVFFYCKEQCAQGGLVDPSNVCDYLATITLH